MPADPKVPIIPARRDLPIIPAREPVDPSSNPAVAVCGACGITLHRVMAYSCPRMDCPCFAVVTCGG
jgi:hypothetical protein